MEASSPLTITGPGRVEPRGCSLKLKARGQDGEASVLHRAAGIYLSNHYLWNLLNGAEFLRIFFLCKNDMPLPHYLQQPRHGSDLNAKCPLTEEWMKKKGCICVLLGHKKE